MGWDGRRSGSSAGNCVGSAGSAGSSGVGNVGGIAGICVGGSVRRNVGCQSCRYMCS